MALTTVDHTLDTTVIDRRPNLPPSPAVAITPCDPWPRPYYLESGLRRVAPYHYTYNTYCKARWRNRTLLDIFSSEFRDRSLEYYREAIEDGRIVLNGQPCKDVNAVVKNGDVISHTLHRHEPPVSAQPIKVINESDEMIVIDKPAGIPVHPAGRYKYNSVVEIMRAERHYAFNPLPCNRLDRLTSGVMFIGKTSKEAEKISEKLRGRTVRKEYIARVKGRFPDGDLEGRNGEADGMRGGIVVCEEPILQISPILGLNRARASGKSAKTLFRRVAYYPAKASAASASDSSAKSEEPKAQTDGDSTTPPPAAAAAAAAANPLPNIEDDGYSIVHCLPLTGRTHQIRVHLQFLGHPISNDPIYSNRRVFGPTLAKGDSSDAHDAEIKARLGKMGKSELAEAHSYAAGKPSTTNGVDGVAGANGLNVEIERLNIDQTHQTTPTQLELLRAQELHRKYGPTADYKPLHHGTLHAGSLKTVPSNHSNPTQSAEEDPAYAAMVQVHDEMVQDYNLRKGEKLTGEICDICQTPLYSDPGPQELGIYLHALAYADVDGKWRYTSPMPEWTRAPGNVSGELMEPPSWDFEVLKRDGWMQMDLEGEKAEGEKRNWRGLEKNKDLQEKGEGES